jgi:hypothetical protein
LKLLEFLVLLLLLQQQIGTLCVCGRSKLPLLMLLLILLPELLPVTHGCC